MQYENIAGLCFQYINFSNYSTLPLDHTVKNQLSECVRLEFGILFISSSKIQVSDLIDWSCSSFPTLQVYLVYKRELHVVNLVCPWS